MEEGKDSDGIRVVVLVVRASPVALSVCPVEAELPDFPVGFLVFV